jgi:hypothetical protein
MLLRTIVTIALLVALLEPAVRAVHGAAQAALRARARMAIVTETNLSVENARRSLAHWVASGNDGSLPPHVTLTAKCAVRDAHACAIEADAVVAWATPASASASPCPNETCFAYDQANDDVVERHAVASVTVQARETNGALLAERTTRLRFRTWREAPYAALDGREDATFSPDFEGSGDDGGMSNGAGTLASTIYRNAVTGATLPANVWRQRAAPATTAPARWSP